MSDDDDDHPTLPPPDSPGSETLHLADQLPPGFRLADHYEIESLLGKGGMGAVYAARNIKVNRPVAVKVLLPELASNPDLLKRFFDEAWAAAALQHPHIIDVYDLDKHGSLQFMVMERLYGDSLAARIDRDGPLSVHFVARIGADVCDAMAAAHGGATKIIHRDLKPENVFLATKGRQQDLVKVLDFGVAKLITKDALAPGLTRTGDRAGTPLYMAPEQIRDSKTVDERADLYSIGVMLYKALTGRVPFDANTLPDLILAVYGQTARPVTELRPEIPQRLAEIVQRALAREPDQRFASAEQMREALLPFVATESEFGSLAPQVVTVSSPPPPKRSPVPYVLGVAAALGLGGAAVFWQVSSAPVTERERSAGAAHAPAPLVGAARPVPTATPDAHPPEPKNVVPPDERPQPAVAGQVEAKAVVPPRPKPKPPSPAKNEAIPFPTFRD